jgi:hypothetical protein
MSFVFADGFVPGVGERVAVVPRGLKSSRALLEALAESLEFPDYFGFNWNALSDCLRDFHWREPGREVIVHADLPALPPAELEDYLSVLSEAQASWRPDEPHALRVVFPAGLKDEVERLLRDD